MALNILNGYDRPQAEFYGDTRLFKSSPKTPKAPDPKETAAAQTASNKETAYWNAVLNNVNQITPYGNLTYTQTGGGKTYNMDAYNAALKSYNDAISAGAQTGAAPKSTSQFVNGEFRYDNAPQKTGSYAGNMPTLDQFQTGDAPPSFTSEIKLSPEQQQILDSQNRQDIALGGLAEGQIGRISNSVSTPYSYGGLGNEVSQDDIAAQQARAEEAYLARLNPQFQRDEESLRTRLINQGIGQGSQAYQREMDTFNQTRNDARQQAILAGQQYGSTAQQQALQRRNQSIQEYDAQRNAPLNEYIGLTSGTQVTNPQFSSQNYQGSAPVDYAGLVNQNYQNQMAQYNAKQAASNNTMSSLFGLGGSFLGAAGQAGGVAALFSDMHLKENIVPIGEENGFPIYEFNYISIPEKRFIGVMAQDVEKIMPEAIGESEGFKTVNYDMIGVKMREV